MSFKSPLSWRADTIDMLLLKIPTILSRPTVLTEYGASWTIPTVTSDRMISACDISYQRRPVHLCWSGISHQGRSGFLDQRLNHRSLQTSHRNFIELAGMRIQTYFHAHLSACFQIHMRECDVLQMWLL